MTEPAFGDVIRLEAYSQRTGWSLTTILSEAAREWLTKKGQPVGLKAALKESARTLASKSLLGLCQSVLRPHGTVVPMG